MKRNLLCRFVLFSVLLLTGCQQTREQARKEVAELSPASTTPIAAPCMTSESRTASTTWSWSTWKGRLATRQEKGPLPLEQMQETDQLLM